MSDASPPTSTLLPPAEQMAAQAIGYLAAEGYTSSLMKLGRPLLNELGRRLVEPGGSRQSILEWLSEEGVETPERNVDRFAQRFREVFKKVMVEWGDKRLVAELSADPTFDHEDLQRLIKNRTTWLFAQEVMAAAPGDLDNGRASNILSLIIAADKGKVEQEKLKLAQADSERKRLETQSKLDIAEQKLSGIHDKVKNLQSQIDAVEKRSQRGETIDPSLFATIRQRLTEVAA